MWLEGFQGRQDTDRKREARSCPPRGPDLVPTAKESARLCL